MSTKWNINLRILAGALVALTVIIVLSGSMRRLEEVLLVTSTVLFTMSVYITNESKFIQSFKTFFIIFNFALFVFMTFNASNKGMAIGLSFFWYFLFTLGLSSKNRESLSYKLNLVVLILMVPLLSFRAIYTGGNIQYFDNNPAVFPTSLIVTSVLALLGIIIAHLDNQEREKLSKEKDQSINWFSTLVNLVSHNLRSPLATILGNSQIIEAKYPSVFKSEETKRITQSVNTLNQIIDRLLKASFVTDQLSNHSLEESLVNAYPTLLINGNLSELNYEKGVSIHLSLEVFLDNAFKFSADKVELTFEGTRIEIRDYGPGLTMEQLESFGSFKEGSLGTLHGIGIPFALRILESIGYGVRAENCNPGLLVVIDKGIGFQDVKLSSTKNTLQMKQKVG